MVDTVAVLVCAILTLWLLKKLKRIVIIIIEEYAQWRDDKNNTESSFDLD